MTEPSDTGVTIEGLAAALRAMVRGGIDASSPPPELLGLACVAERARDAGYSPDDGLTLGLRDVLADALDALGDGPGPSAVRLLLGADQDSRGRPVAERRTLAAGAFGRSVDNFNRKHAPRLLATLAAELYRIETQTSTTATEDTTSAGPALPAAADTIATETAPVVGDADTAEGAPVPALGPEVTPTGAGAGGVGGGRRPRLRRALGVLRPGRRPASPFRDRLVLVAGVAGWVWWRWGLDRALLFVVLPALVAHGVGLVAGMVRGQIAARLPRLVVVVFASVLAVNRLTAASGDDPAQPVCDILTDLSAFPDAAGNCVESPLPDLPSPAEVSPNYTPTTYTDTHELVEPSCPPEGNGQRLTNFTGPPPQCIEPGDDYTMTVRTSHGDFWVDLYSERSPQAVNSLYFLAGWHYWDGTVVANPSLPVRDAQEQCLAELGDDGECEDRIDEYMGIRWAQAQPPFDPVSGDYGPGYNIEAEPAQRRYDTESPNPTHYVVLPWYTTTEHPDTGDVNIYVNVSDWVIVFAPTMRDALNDNRDLITPVGELDDPEHVISYGPANPDSGRQTSAPVVIETVYVETPPERVNRQEREQITARQQELKGEIDALETEIDQETNPPVGDQPAGQGELADERERLAEHYREFDQLRERLNQLAAEAP